ncbi:MAG: hypothetical protein ACRCWB_06835 [Enterovibrio sp.]
MVKKRERVTPSQDAIEAFASGAEGLSAQPEKKSNKEREKVFKRLTFSLTDHEDELIEQLSLKPRTFRCSRSQVVKAAVAHLATLSEQQIIELLEKE